MYLFSVKLPLSQVVLPCLSEHVLLGIRSDYDYRLKKLSISSFFINFFIPKLRWLINMTSN